MFLFFNTENIYWKVQNKILTTTHFQKRDREDLTGGRGRGWEMKTDSDLGRYANQLM